MHCAIRNINHIYFYAINNRLSIRKTKTISIWSLIFMIYVLVYLYDLYDINYMYTFIHFKNVNSMDSLQI